MTDTQSAPLMVTASFTVNATHTVEFATTSRKDRLDPNELAQAAYDADPGISLCHQCSDEVSGAETGELVSMTVGDKDYVRYNGQWVAKEDASRHDPLDALIFALQLLAAEPDPVERARSCPQLMATARSVLYRVRVDAVRKTMEQPFIRQADLARLLGTTRNKVHKLIQDAEKTTP